MATQPGSLRQVRERELVLATRALFDERYAGRPRSDDEAPSRARLEQVEALLAASPGP